MSFVGFGQLGRLSQLVIAGPVGGAAGAVFGAQAGQASQYASPGQQGQQGPTPPPTMGPPAPTQLPQQVAQQFGAPQQTAQAPARPVPIAERVAPRRSATVAREKEFEQHLPEPPTKGYLMTGSGSKPVPLTGRARYGAGSGRAYSPAGRKYTRVYTPVDIEGKRLYRETFRKRPQPAPTTALGRAFKWLSELLTGTPPL